MKKILFLDIDGVLNTDRQQWHCQMNGIAPVDRLGYAFDQKAVANLAAILSATGAEIVISSSWKFLGLAALRRIWDSRKLSGHILDVTPDNESKGMEVADWLSQHGG